MTEQQEQYIHFKACIQSLNKALNILEIIKQQPQNKLIEPAFKFALIEYSKSYTSSYGKFKRRYFLGLENVPPEYLGLHKEILNSRDQIHAHFDLTRRDANLYVFEANSKKFTGISQNIIDETEHLIRIDEIIVLIQKTLNSMYEKAEKLKAELTSTIFLGSSD